MWENDRAERVLFFLVLARRGGLLRRFSARRRGSCPFLLRIGHLPK